MQPPTPRSIRFPAVASWAAGQRLVPAVKLLPLLTRLLGRAFRSMRAALRLILVPNVRLSLTNTTTLPFGLTTLMRLALACLARMLDKRPNRFSLVVLLVRSADRLALIRARPATRSIVALAFVCPPVLKIRSAILRHKSVIAKASFLPVSSWFPAMNTPAVITAAQWFCAMAGMTRQIMSLGVIGIRMALIVLPQTKQSLLILILR